MTLVENRPPRRQILYPPLVASLVISDFAVLSGFPITKRVPREWLPTSPVQSDFANPSTRILVVLRCLQLGNSKLKTSIRELSGQ